MIINIDFFPFSFLRRYVSAGCGKSVWKGLVTCGGSVSDKSVSLLVVGTAQYIILKSKIRFTRNKSGYTFLLNMMIKKRRWKINACEWLECPFFGFFLFFLVHVLAYATGRGKDEERG